ncbi:MAG: hypothetical protein J07HB67_02262 [halophilic archaeon J07HB67]|nr:MAG: hypothetical protein J07HB67_02262 [halophilic archaeon J07HB67]
MGAPSGSQRATPEEGRTPSYAKVVYSWRTVPPSTNARVTSPHTERRVVTNCVSARGSRPASTSGRVAPARSVGGTAANAMRGRVAISPLPVYWSAKTIHGTVATKLPVTTTDTHDSVGSTTPTPAATPTPAVRVNRSVLTAIARVPGSSTR